VGSKIDENTNPNHGQLVKFFTKAASRALAASKIQPALELINPYLYAVEERIKEQARAFDPAIEGYVAYACGSSGKRLRPALVLLAGGASGNISAGHVDLAVAIELVHLASLVHDDIMDGAELRRDQPTASAKWGNSLAVLLGDALFAHALKLTTSFSNQEICRRVAHAARDVCSGEIIQTQRRHDVNLSIPEYLRIIELKTAALFAASGELGALLSGAAPEIITALKSFGARLGTAYQVYDDCLDLAGSTESAGKDLGTDLRKGKLTLPMLYLLEDTDSNRHRQLNEILLRGDEKELIQIEQEVVAKGCLKRAVETTKQLVLDAQRELQRLPVNKYSLALHEVGGFLADTVDKFAAAA
jgi:octaprenyl-diphosphate synthase